uniref:T-box domain-containing protein n=1 Tax=Acanthochromis polyacanthus TaxID=80966 RepID=A0A3Q1GEK6_9TELE
MLLVCLHFSVHLSGSYFLSASVCSAPMSSNCRPKPAATSTSEISPATSCIASASDSLTCSVTSLTSESWVSSVPSTTFGTADLENNFPAVLTFKGISVTLENNSVWKQFYSCGTEMILTKQGRRMFPYCRYRLAGLDPDQQYNLVLSIVPSGQYRYRWSTSKWEIHGPAEHQSQGLIRAFSHHYSPCRGSEWMSCLVSFYKLKLTNNSQDQDGHIILHSMHRYIPRLHVIPVLDGNQPTADKPVVMGPESMTFTFPQTEFMAVTTYQNFRITQLKINHNPFAKGFREDGHNPRLQRVSTEAQPVVKTEPQESDLQPAEEPKEDEQEAVDLRTQRGTPRLKNLDGAHTEALHSGLLHVHPGFITSVPQEEEEDQQTLGEFPGKRVEGNGCLPHSSPQPIIDSRYATGAG